MTLVFLIAIVIIIYYYTNNYKMKNVPSEDKTALKELEMKLIEVNSKTRVILSNNETIKMMKLRKISDALNNKKDILFFTSGKRINDNVFIILTNGNFVALNDKTREVIKIPYEKINDIKKNKIIVKINNYTFAISNNDLNIFCEKLEDQIEANKNISIHINREIKKDVADKILKLQSLYEEGILTEYEFNIKKKELLDKKED